MELIVIIFIILVFVAIWLKTPTEEKGILTPVQANMPGNLVTIAAFDNPVTANLYNTKLASEDIDCFIENEYVVMMDWLYWNAVGGVKLRVKECDAQKAAEILKIKVTPTENELKEMHSTIGIHCPECSSIMTYPKKIYRREAFLAILFLGFPILFRNKEWECRDCGHKWGYKEITPESLKNIKFWDAILFFINVLGILSFLSFFLINAQKNIISRYISEYDLGEITYIILTIPNWLDFIIFAAILGYYVVRRHAIKDASKRLRIDLIVFASLVWCLLAVLSIIR